jgi:hypothetical protein
MLYAMSSGKLSSTFHRLVVPSKRRWHFTIRQPVTSQKTWTVRCVLIRFSLFIYLRSKDKEKCLCLNTFSYRPLWNLKHTKPKTILKHNYATSYDSDWHVRFQKDSILKFNFLDSFNCKSPNMRIKYYLDRHIRYHCSVFIFYALYKERSKTDKRSCIGEAFETLMAVAGRTCWYF